MAVFAFAHTLPQPLPANTPETTTPAKLSSLAGVVFWVVFRQPGRHLAASSINQWQRSGGVCSRSAFVVPGIQPR